MRKRIRFVAMLLTPLVAWATSLLGGWLGAVWGGQLTWLVVGGVVGGIVGFAAWLLLLRFLGKRTESNDNNPQPDAS